MQYFDQSQVRDAARMCADWHGHQIDRDGELHSVHCGRVAQRFSDSFLQVCSYLHDIFEDTTISREEVACNFGWEVVAVVDRLSEKEGEQYDIFIKRIAQCPHATMIKIADIEDNLARPDAKSFPKHQLYIMSLEYLKSQQSLSHHE